MYLLLLHASNLHESLFSSVFVPGSINTKPNRVLAGGYVGSSSQPLGSCASTNTTKTKYQRNHIDCAVDGLGAHLLSADFGV